jgi:hypothetical protein
MTHPVEQIGLLLGVHYDLPVDPGCLAASVDRRYPSHRHQRVAVGAKHQLLQSRTFLWSPSCGAANIRCPQPPYLVIDLVPPHGVPVIWSDPTLEQQGAGHWRKIVELNPLLHYVDIVRAPLLGADQEIRHWVVVLVLSMVGWIIAMFAMRQYRARVTYCGVAHPPAGHAGRYRARVAYWVWPAWSCRFDHAKRSRWCRRGQHALEIEHERAPVWGGRSGAGRSGTTVTRPAGAETARGGGSCWCRRGG